MSDGELLLGATYVLSLVAALLALPVTLLLLRLYRRSILRLMSVRGPEEETPASFVGLSTRERSVDTTPTLTTVEHGFRRNVAVVAAVTIFSAIGYALLLLVANGVAVSVFRVAYFVVLFSWPGVIGIWIATAGRRRWVISSIVIYLVALLGTGLLGGTTLGMTFDPWIGAMLPTAAVIAFLARPFRGVGPIVLGTMMIGILGAQVAAATVIGSPTLLDMWVELSFAVGITDAVVMFWGLYLAGFLGAGLIAFPVVRLLAAWYARGGFSDQMLLLGSVFLVFAIDHSLAGGPTDPATFVIGMAIYVASAIVSFVAYRLVIPAGLEPTNLLLLRVFSTERSHQRLLDRVTARWRHVGAVRLIGAPDLAVATVEPDEFLAFVSGRLRRLFIATTAALEGRLAGLQPRLDRDGRFRVDEFFCFDTTWRQTVARLLGHSDVVLMDLRGLESGNAGALAELRMLAATRAVAQTVLLIDSTTDRSLLVGELSVTAGGSGPAIVEVDDDYTPDRVLEACLGAAAQAGFRDVA